MIYRKKAEDASSVLFSRQVEAASPANPKADDKPEAKPGLDIYSASEEGSAKLTQYQRNQPRATQDAASPPTANNSADAGLKTLYQRSSPPAPQSIPTPTQATPQQGLPEAAPPIAPNAFAPGQQISAKLATAILALEGGQVPVVAESEGAIWIGAAGLDASRRVQVVFDRVLQDGQVTELQAMALSPQGVPGLEAALEEQAPSLASDMLRATLNGVSTYVQGLASASSSTVLPGGGAVQSKEAPPLGLTLLGEIGKLFALPQGQASVVRLARVEKGTPILILVGVGAKPGVRP